MKAKYIILALLCFVFSQAGLAQTTSKLFEKYADMDNVTSVYISKAMFKMMPTMQTMTLC